MKDWTAVKNPESVFFCHKVEMNKGWIIRGEIGCDSAPNQPLHSLWNHRFFNISEATAIWTNITAFMIFNESQPITTRADNHAIFFWIKSLLVHIAVCSQDGLSVSFSCLSFPSFLPVFADSLKLSHLWFHRGNTSHDTPRLLSDLRPCLLYNQTRASAAKYHGR